LGSKDTVSSPTFTLNKIYQAKNLQVHHFDFYRLSDAGIVADQLAESLESPKVITVVEWSNIVSEVLLKDRLTIELKPVATNSDERQITIHYLESQTEMIKELETNWAGSRP